MAKELMKGNEAMAEAAVRAGMKFYAGYPITPQSEVLEYLVTRLPEVGGTFLQSESELAAVSMAYGAAACGHRTMITSSGPGFTLFHEGISYIASAELPCLIVDVMRYGSGLGDIFVGQSDYFQAVKNGGHSDYRTIVYAPNSVQEIVDLVRFGFEKAEQYRNPVVLLSDASIGQMMESVEFPQMLDYNPDNNDWALKGKGDGEFKRHTSVMYYMDEHDTYIKNKYDKIEENEQKWEEYKTEDAEIILVAYGISSRICEEAIDIAREKGQKVGLIRPISLYPFPKKAFENKNNTSYIVVEMTALGQMIEDVAIATRMQKDIYNLTCGTKVYDVIDVNKIIDDVFASKSKKVY